VKSWDEPQYSIQNLGIEESYGFGVLNEGQAIAVAKNVKVRQNEMSTPGALIPAYRLEVEESRCVEHSYATACHLATNDRMGSSRRWRRWTGAMPALSRQIVRQACFPFCLGCR
jgi:hypothetical protein